MHSDIVKIILNNVYESVQGLIPKQTKYFCSTQIKHQGNDYSHFSDLQFKDSFTVLAGNPAILEGIWALESDLL